MSKVVRAAVRDLATREVTVGSIVVVACEISRRVNISCGFLSQGIDQILAAERLNKALYRKLRYPVVIMLAKKNPVTFVMFY